MLNAPISRALPLGSQNPITFGCGEVLLVANGDLSEAGLPVYYPVQLGDGVNAVRLIYMDGGTAQASVPALELEGDIVVEGDIITFLGEQYKIDFIDNLKAWVYSEERVEQAED